MTCREVVKDAAGAVVELRCTYDPATRGGDAPDGRRPKATLHWVSAADAVPAEVRLYDHLFAAPFPGADGATCSPTSTRARRQSSAERSSSRRSPVRQSARRVQFERLGYFAPDPDGTPERPVFNRTVTLKDTWAKVKGQAKSGS